MMFSEIEIFSFFSWKLRGYTQTFKIRPGS